MILSDVLTSSIAWRPADGDTVFVAAVEADLPIARSLVGEFPPRIRGHVFLEVERAADVGHLDVPSRVGVTWLVRERGQSLQRAVDAWLSELVPDDLDREHRVYGWVSGERAARSVSSR